MYGVKCEEMAEEADWAVAVKGPSRPSRRIWRHKKLGPAPRRGRACCKTEDRCEESLLGETAAGH